MQGVITDENGGAIVGARLRFSRDFALGGQTSEEVAAEVLTGKGGTYSTALPAGSWIVQIDVPRRWAYFQEYYDGVSNWDQLTRLVVGDGETKTLNADLRCQTTCPAPPTEDPKISALAVGLIRSALVTVAVSGKPQTATGTVVAEVGLTRKEVALRNGRATILLTGLTPGRQDVELFYTGDDNIRGIDAKRTVRVW